MRINVPLEMGTLFREVYYVYKTVHDHRYVQHT
jgi:hypothetical protein